MGDSQRSRRGRRNKERGKEDERLVAKALGGQRHPADSGAAEDVAHDWLTVQVKGGKTTITRKQADALDRIRAGASPTKLPCVVLIDRSGPRLRKAILFDLDDFAAWNGLPPKGGEA